MRYAIVSDIHANLQAWNAVLDDITCQDVDDIICLGDIVGYGPSPVETLESVYDRVENIILGNHDAVIAGKFDASEFNDNARRIIEWTGEQLSDVAGELIEELPPQLEGENFLATHAEVPQPERFGYIEDADDALGNFDACDNNIVFTGHTHEPRVFVMERAKPGVTAARAFNVKPRENYRYIVNVGSVGDPRDDDVRACYCIYDTEIPQLFFRRVDFDVEAYREQLAQSGLAIKPDFLRRYDGEGGEATAIQEWVLNDSNRTAPIRNRPKKILRLNRSAMSPEQKKEEEEEREEKERKKELLKQADENKKRIIEAQREAQRKRREKEEQKRLEMQTKMNLLRHSSMQRAEKERLEKEQAEKERKAKRAETARRIKKAQTTRKAQQKTPRKPVPRRPVTGGKTTKTTKTAAKTSAKTSKNQEEARELDDLRKRVEEQRARQKEKERRRQSRAGITGRFKRLKDRMVGNEKDDDSR